MCLTLDFEMLYDPAGFSDTDQTKMDFSNIEIRNCQEALTLNTSSNEDFYTFTKHFSSQGKDEEIKI